MKAFSDGIVDKYATKHDGVVYYSRIFGSAMYKPLGKRPCDVDVDVNFVLSMFGKEKLKWYVENHAKEISTRAAEYVSGRI